MVIPWSTSFLDGQIQSQKQFFTTCCNHKKDKATNSKIYNALKKERDLEEKLRIEYAKCHGDRRKAMSNKAWVEAGASRLLPERIATTDALLKAAGQSRTDWAVDGELWKTFAKSDDPAFDVYQCYEREREQEELIQSFRANLPAETLPEDDHRSMWLTTQAVTLERLRLTTNERLKKHGFLAEDHRIGSASWIRFKSEQVKEELEVILQDLMAQAASRSEELKTLHSRVSGQREAQPLITSLYKRYPMISSLVKKFNDTARQLPPPYTVSLLSVDDVMPKVDHSIGEVPEASQEALWNLELLRVQSAVGHINCVIEPKDDHMIWAQSALVREAISQRLRFLRANEEIELLTSEGNRLWRWTKDRAEVTLAFLRESQQFRPQALDFVWEQLRLLREWLSCNADVARERSPIATLSTSQAHLLAISH